MYFMLQGNDEKFNHNYINSNKKGSLFYDLELIYT